MVGGGKKVWFERGSSHQSNVLLGHIRDTLDKAGETRALEVPTVLTLTLTPLVHAACSQSLHL